MHAGYPIRATFSLLLFYCAFYLTSASASQCKELFVVDYKSKAAVLKQRIDQWYFNRGFVKTSKQRLYWKKYKDHMHFLLRSSYVYENNEFRVNDKKVILTDEQVRMIKLISGFDFVNDRYINPEVLLNITTYYSSGIIRKLMLNIDRYKTNKTVEQSEDDRHKEEEQFEDLLLTAHEGLRQGLLSFIFRKNQSTIPDSPSPESHTPDLTDEEEDLLKKLELEKLRIELDERFNRTSY